MRARVKAVTHKSPMFGLIPLAGAMENNEKNHLHFDSLRKNEGFRKRLISTGTGHILMTADISPLARMAAVSLLVYSEIQASGLARIPPSVFASDVMMGSSRKAASRVLKELSDTGIIVWDKKTDTVFCPLFLENCGLSESFLQAGLKDASGRMKNPAVIASIDYLKSMLNRTNETQNGPYSGPKSAPIRAKSALIEAEKVNKNNDPLPPPQRHKRLDIRDKKETLPPVPTKLTLETGENAPNEKGGRDLPIWFRNMQKRARENPKTARVADDLTPFNFDRLAQGIGVDSATVAEAWSEYTGSDREKGINSRKSPLRDIAEFAKWATTLPAVEEKKQAVIEANKKRERADRMEWGYHEGIGPPKTEEERIRRQRIISRFEANGKEVCDQWRHLIKREISADESRLNYYSQHSEKELNLWAAVRWLRSAENTDEKEAVES